MIVDSGKYFVYRHIRLDKNEPFYVGIGKKTPTDIKKHTHKRAFSSKDRNRFWQFIVGKSGYSVEVLVESDDRGFIQEKEKEFISLHGRRDFSTGTLVNLTDGGDNGLNRSAYSIALQLETAKKTGSYQKSIERIKMYARKKGSNGGFLDKETFLYSIEGWFIRKFNTREDCALFLGNGGSNVTGIIKKKASCNGFYITDYLVRRLDLSQFKESRSNEIEAVQICPKTFDAIMIYPSLTVAAANTKTYKSRISYACRNFIKAAGYYWSYRETYPNFLETIYKNNGNNAI